MRAPLLQRIIQSSTCAKTSPCHKLQDEDVTPFTRIQSADGWAGFRRGGHALWSWWSWRSLNALPHSTVRREWKSRAAPVGQQKVIAQIIEIDGDFIKLTVLKSELLENTVAKVLVPHKVGTVITKKRATLLRGEPQRLHWSEEDVRKALLAHPQSS